MEITKDERLAFLAALDKRVKPALEDAKNEARAEIMDAYAENGTDRKPTGEVVEWAGWNPKAAKTAAVRGCKPEDVLRAFGPRLQSMDAVALLDGEVE